MIFDFHWKVMLKKDSRVGAREGHVLYGLLRRCAPRNDVYLYGGSDTPFGLLNHRIYRF